MNKSAPEKIVVIRFSSIGDIVLCTPVLRCLKKIPAKNIYVHFVTKKKYRSLVEHNPNIDRLHLLDGSLYGIIKKLKSEGVSAIIDLHNNLRSALVKMALRKPSGSFFKMNIEKWLLTAFKINRLPDKHIVDRYFDAASVAGVINDGEGLDFFFSDKSPEWPEELPEEFRQGPVAFVIGGKHATKRLPDEKIISICKKLGPGIVLLGDSSDRNSGKVIAAACGNGVFNGCGLFSLQQSAFIVRMADVVISHDTGLMHIAAAFRKRIVSVWGNTVPAFGMVPYMPGHPERSVIVEVKDLSCRPCTKIGYSKCPRGHFDCMKKIDEDKVVSAAREFILQQHKTA